ncbi:hypothetical protein J6590_015768 [Homalodisca vitripennis]|nr:hypothetical protein J6590_015768 [Homalodisca vitripennis]
MILTPGICTRVRLKRSKTSEMKKFELCISFRVQNPDYKIQCNVGEGAPLSTLSEVRTKKPTLTQPGDQRFKGYFRTTTNGRAAAACKDRIAQRSSI